MCADLFIFLNTRIFHNSVISDSIAQICDAVNLE